MDNKLKTTIDELASSMGKVIPTASANAVSIEQLGASYAIMTSNGIATAESTTYLNSMLNEMGETGSQTDKILREMTGKSFKGLMEEGASLGDVLNILSDYAKASGLNLQDLFSSSEAGKASLVLSKNAGDDFNKMLEEMNGSLGATDEAFKKVDETTGSKLKKSINELKNAFLGMGDNLAPIIERVTEAIKNIAEAIGEMDDETIDSIIGWTKLATEIGVASKVIGGIFGTVSDVTGGLSKMASILSEVSGASTTLAGSATTAGSAVGSSGLAGSLSALGSVALPLATTIGALAVGFVGISSAMDVSNNSTTKAKEEFNLLEQGMAKLMGVQLKTREELESTGIIYKEFGENISPEFQKAVEGMREDIANFNLELSETSLDGVLSQEEIDSLSAKVQEAIDGAISAINEKQEETEQAMSDLFATDGVFTEKEQEIMNWWSTRGDKEKQEAITLQEEINEIEQNAFKEGRALTPEEEQAIRDKYERIKQIELEAKARNSDELKYAEIDFQNQIATLDAEGASKLMQQKLQQADELKLQKKNEFDMLKAQVMEGYDSMSEEDKKYADEAVQALEEGWQQYLSEDEAFRSNLYEQACAGNQELKDVLNKYNGEILTEQDRNYQKSLEMAKNQYDGINNISESGMYRLYDNQRGTYADIAVMVDEKTGEIIGYWDKTNGEVGGYSKEMGDSAIHMGQDIDKASKNINDSLGRIDKCYVDTKGNLVNANGEIVSSMEQVKTATDGTREGIVKINGVPFKIKVDKDGVIKNLKSIDEEANYTARDRDCAINFYATGLESINYTYEHGVAVPRALGTPNEPKDTLAVVNEKGFELFDTKPNTEAYAISSMSYGDLAYIPQGTRIKSNLNSTQEMKAEIKKEIARYNNITTDDLRVFANEIIDAIKKYSDVDINIDNDFNIAQTIENEFEEDRLANNITDYISAELRRFGRLTTK